MKAALIVPKGSKYGKNPYLKQFLAQNDIVSHFYGTWETPNLSLLTVAGLFLPQDQLCFVDEDHGVPVPFEEDFDLVLLTGMTQQIPRAYEIADRFRSRSISVAIGGIHASLYPEEALQHCDHVLVGEGEETFPAFYRDFLAGQAKPVYRCEGFCDLTRSPVPRYDLVDSSLYASYSIQTTRGCPRTCAYCTLPVLYGPVYRHKTVEQVIAEIHAIQAVAPHPFIFFADDNMFIDEAFSKELLKRVAQENILWGTQTDISVAQRPEILNLLRQAGCRWLFIGFENVRQDSLQLLDRKAWKASMCERYASLIEKIHRAGIQIWGSFLFGTDNDPPDIFDHTLEFTLDNGIYSGSFTILTPLPGTELFVKMQREGRILDYDWSRYTFWDVVFQPKRMSAQQLAEGVASLYQRFYSQENAARRLAAIRRQMKGLRGDQV